MTMSWRANIVGSVTAGNTRTVHVYVGTPQFYTGWQEEVYGDNVSYALLPWQNFQL